MNRFGDAPVDETAPLPDAAQKPATNRFGDYSAEQLPPTPALDQLFGQIQAQKDTQANTLLQGELAARQAGQSLVKGPTNLEGTTYTPQQTSPGGPVDFNQKAALSQAYQQEYAGRVQAQTPEQLDAQSKAASLATNTPVENFGGGFAQTFGNVRAGLVKTYDPKAGNAMAEDFQNTYSSDPDSNAGMAGRVTAGATLAAAAPAAPLATATIFGAQTFGDVRGEVAARRAAGQVITPTQEFEAAGGQALATFLVSKLGAGYNEKLAKSLMFENAALRQQGVSTVANTIKQYALSGGVGMSDMAAMTMANNLIAKATYDPSRQVSEGAGEAMAVGALAGPVGMAVHGGAAGAPGQHQTEAPVKLDSTELQNAAPTPEQLKNTMTAPPADAVNNTAAPEAAKGPTSLDTAKTKFRIQDGANSRGVEIQFEDPTDKALYVATQPRKGKLQREAVKFLEANGYDQNAIDNYGDHVRSRADEAAKGFTGDVLKLPKASEVGAADAGVGSPGSNEDVSAGKGAVSGDVQPEVNDAGVPKRLAPLAENAAAANEVRPAGRAEESAGSPPVERGNASANGESASGVLGRNEEAAGSPEGQPAVSREGKAFLPSKADEATAVKAAEPLVKNFKQVAPKTKDHAEAARVFAKRGIKVVYFQGEGKGFRMKNHPGVLFVNADKPAASFREAISHEFIHELHDSRPGLFQELAEAVGPKDRAKWEKWYEGEFAKMRPGEKPAALNEEGVTSPIGKLASSNERVWTAAMGKDPTLLQKIGDFARPFLAKFSSKSRQVEAAVKAFKATLDNPIGNTRHPKEYASASFLPSERVRDEAKEYSEKAGLPFKQTPADLKVNPARAKQIAKWYDEAKHEPNSPEVKASYDALKKETLAQFNFLKEKGIKLEPWTDAGQPYEGSKEMLKDVQENKHLYFFTGGDMPADHPLAGEAPGTDGLTYNDVFRAVHDYFGHAKEGTGFGPKGEENAWASHMQMYSPQARPAMTAETRGQNSWVNFGPHGEANRANPAETKYAEQKAVVAPEEFLKNNREHIQEAGKALEGTLRKQTGQDDLVSARDEAKALAEKQDKQLAERPNFLPSSKFLEDDVKPTIARAAEGVKKAWEGIKSLVAPFARTKQAKDASLIIREKRGAELAQRLDRLNEAFHKAEDVVGKLSVAQQHDITDKAERGVKQSDPALQPIADAIRGVYDDRAKQVQALGIGKMAVLIKDYMGHLYEKPAAAAKVLVGLASKSPLQGDKGFLKARKIPFQSDAIAKGLKPVTDNPVSMMMLKVHQMDKFITAHQTFNEMKSIGLAKKVRARDVMKMEAKGYAKIDDNIATIYAKPSRRGAVQVAGYWMAPEAVANVVNNYLSPGLSSSKYFGAAFRGYRSLGNSMNQAQLGLSFFHAAFVTGDTAVSSFAIGLKNLAKGRFLTGGRQIGEGLTLIAPSVRAWANGNKIIKEWKSPGSTTPEIAQIVDAMKAGGGRINMDAVHMTNWRTSLKKAWNAGNVLGSMFRLPGAALEYLSAPILEKMVPKIKAGVFFEMAQHELANLGPSPDRMKLREAMGKAWDSVDNRMGELVYDNLFWNKTVKDLAMATTRSVGWNLGTLREVGGGAFDLARNAASVSVGRGRNAEFSHRAAYTIALPLMTGIIGGLLHKLLTGDNPSELKDYYFPKTGQKDKDGHDVRLSLPSYMKDVFAYSADPVATVSHKVHPMLNTMLEMLSNKDYYGTKIRNEDDPIVKQALDLAKHAGEGFIPFGAREVSKLVQEGQGTKSLLPLLGITQARKDITNSKAELMASKLASDSIPPGGRTTEDVERQKTVRELADNLKAKQPGALEDIKTALKEGRITESSLATIKDRLENNSFERTVKHLSVEDGMKVWDVATPDERRQMAPFLIHHAMNATNLTPEKKQAILTRLAQDWATLKAEK